MVCYIVVNSGSNGRVNAREGGLNPRHCASNKDEHTCEGLHFLHHKRLTFVMERLEKVDSLAHISIRDVGNKAAGVQQFVRDVFQMGDHIIASILSNKIESCRLSRSEVLSRMKMVLMPAATVCSMQTRLSL